MFVEFCSNGTTHVEETVEPAAPITKTAAGDAEPVREKTPEPESKEETPEVTVKDLSVEEKQPPQQPETKQPEPEPEPQPTGKDSLYLC